MIYKRADLMNHKMKYTHEEIQEYNARAYDSIGTGMMLVKDSDKWVPPKIKGRTFRRKGIR